MRRFDSQWGPALLLGTTILAGGACGGGGGKTNANGGTGPIALPRLYPPVRASTPAALIADPAYSAVVPKQAALSVAAASAGAFPLVEDAVGLATVVQDRLYSMGPTEILRIVSAVDARTATLDTRPSEHPCLTSMPISKIYAMPSGETFEVKLQCLQRFGSGSAGDGWMAFGFGTALEWDGGAADAGDDAGSPSPDGGALGTEGGGRDFYLVEGQSGGMGSAYHFDRETGIVEAWIAVADSRAPSNSQVLMHMLADRGSNTLELTLGGSGVGFCAAHLKTGGDFLFVDAKTNAPPPPGTPMSPGVQYCDSARAGCFAISALTTDLGGDATACSGIARPTFAIATDLDASADPGANVTPPTLYTVFNAEPAAIPSF